MLKEAAMDMTSSGLRAIGLDVKALARKPAEPARQALLPPQVLTLTRYWLALGGKTPPLWSQFEMIHVGDVVPTLSFLRCNPDHTFTFTFMGSAVAAVLGEDLTGCAVSAGNPIWGEIDWYHRCKPVADVADIQAVSGATNPPYTARVEFITVDFPFMDDAGAAVSHTAGVTVARLN